MPSDEGTAASGLKEAKQGLCAQAGFGIGAILGPLITGWAMESYGPFAFWLTLGITFGGMSAFALYRMTQRDAVAAEDTESYIGVLPTASPIVVEAAGVWAAEQSDAEPEE